jgi:hypothetical protein
MFSQLKANTVAPLGADLLSLWMSDNRRILGPGSLIDDGFTLVSQQPTATESRYQTLDDALDAALNTFTTEAQGWTAATRARTVTSQRSTFVSALQRFIGSLSGVQAAINALVVAVRAELMQVKTAPRRSAAGIKVWIRAFERDLNAGTDAGRPVRRGLGLPTF